MGLFRLAKGVHSRFFGSFGLDDPRPIAAEAPYTYYLPSEIALSAVRKGDWVKAIFRPHPANRKFDAERMWVCVDQLAADGFHGTLDNEPSDIPQLKCGTPVFVPRTHVISIDWLEGHEPPPEPPRRWYWDRCLVDDCVLNGRSPVDYLYREEPEFAEGSDEDRDSGWRLRGTEAAIAEDEANGVSIQYVALGAVLNKDDRWLHLIDEPVGEAFRWWADEQRFVRLKPE